MTVFAVFKVNQPQVLGPVIAREFPDDHLKLQEGEWLISARATPEELSARLGIKNGTSGSAIIFSMRGYHGRAATNIWDWIKTKVEAESGS